MTRASASKTRRKEAEATERAKPKALPRPEKEKADLETQRLSTLFLVASLVLLGIRLYAASNIGFGDSEALYAAYAAHPQPAYLDHPGLVGLVMHALGDNGLVTPLRVHLFTAFGATIVPWLAYFTALKLGASRRRAVLAGLVLLTVPQTAVGLFGLTPDLLLAVTWLATLLCAGLGLEEDIKTTKGAALLLTAGLFAGISCAAKASGVLLVASLVVTYVSLARQGSPQARSRWPWAGLVSGLVVLAPIFVFEQQHGWPMLVHRLVDTQHGAGIALRNLGALVGGQLGYVSPVFCVLAVIVARDLVRTRNENAISRLLFFGFAVPIVPLTVFCLWSPVAEPHWIAPALLVLPIHAARRATTGSVLVSRRWFVAGLGTAAALTVFAHAWVLLPESGKLLPASVDAKADISSELYGWPRVTNAIKDQLKSVATPFDPEGREVVVVGPHWVVCGQLAAAMPTQPVGCATPVRDDFDDWLPREKWKKSEHVLFVTDARFPGDGHELLPEHTQSGVSRVRIIRGGRVARTFELTMYEKRATAARD